MDLLLLGDEQEEMVNRYIDTGEMFIGRVGCKAVAVCVVTREGSGLVEIKNIAVDPACRRRGYYGHENEASTNNVTNTLIYRLLALSR